MKEKIMTFSKRILKHELISGSIYVFFGYIVASFLNFVLNLYVARRFTASDYGIYASLLSLYTLAGLPSQSLIAIIVRFVADYSAKGKVSMVASLFVKIYRFAFLISAGIFFSFLTLAVPIQNFLKIDNSSYVILVGGIVSLFYLAIVNIAFLQGLLRFGLLSLTYILGGLLRLISAIILIGLGLKVYGVFIAILIAVLIPFVLQFIPLRSLIGKKTTDSNISNKEILGYAFPTTIAMLSLMSLTSTDVVLVKHFFSSTEAGLYGGLSLVSKVIFYFTGPLASVMFPLLIRRHNLGQNFNNLFYLTLLLVTVPSFGIALFYILFPILSIKLFLGGGEYLKVASYLPLFGIYLAVFSLLNVCVNFFLSLKRTGISIFVAGAAIVQILLISFFHKDFFQVIAISTGLSIVLLLVLILIFIRDFENLEKLKKMVLFLNNPAT